MFKGLAVSFRLLVRTSIDKVVENNRKRQLEKCDQLVITSQVTV